MAKFLLIFISVLYYVHAFSQSDSTKKWTDKFYVSGYIKYMNTNSFVNLDTIITDNLFHNRVNIKYYPNHNITFSLDFRNRLFYGETVEMTPHYADFIGKDNGDLDLSFNLFTSPSLILNTTIDRANIEWSKGKWNVRLGRQRINWGINMAWNPNDLFNAYNFIDFDYQERPGSDALHIQYFHKPMSQFELAYKPGKDLDHSIIAGLYKFNKKRFDFQIIGANYLTDLTLGTGWAGNLFQAGFKGEISYFQPKQNFSDTLGVLVISTSFDLTLNNGIYLNVSGLYNSGSSKGSDLSTFQATFNNLSAKNLMPTPFTILGQISGAFSPIFGGGMTAMYLPAINGLFLIPTLNYSILENWDIDFVGQLFFANYPSKFTNVSNSVFFRLRWSY